MTVLLKYLTIEHHELLELYPHKNVMPKHHFMVHYLACIHKMLVHMGSMRFKAKHKVLMNKLKNFKNITKSLAKSHQMSIGVSLGNRGMFPKVDVQNRWDRI